MSKNLHWLFILPEEFEAPASRATFSKTQYRSQSASWDFWGHFPTPTFVCAPLVKKYLLLVRQIAHFCLRSAVERPWRHLEKKQGTFNFSLLQAIFIQETFVAHRFFYICIVGSLLCYKILFDQPAAPGLPFENCTHSPLQQSILYLPSLYGSAINYFTILLRWSVLVSMSSLPGTDL